MKNTISSLSSVSATSPVSPFVVGLMVLLANAAPAQNEVDKDLLSQSRSQQSVGRSVVTTVQDLEDLISDLESNGLIQEGMAEKIRSAKGALNSISEEHIPQATAKLRAAALHSIGRKENLETATKEVDHILNQLEKTAKEVGEEQKRSAYEQILTELAAETKELSEQTKEWGKEQLSQPEQAADSKQEVMDQQAEIEAQWQALEQMLETEIEQQDNAELAEELEDILDALKGEQAQPEPAEQQENQLDEEGSVNNQENQEMMDGGEISAEEALEDMQQAFQENDAGAALAAQEELQQRLAEALKAMGSAAGQNAENNQGDNNQAENLAGEGNEAEEELAANQAGEQLEAGLAFGEDTAGGEIGEEALEDMLNGESVAEGGDQLDNAQQADAQKSMANNAGEAETNQSGSGDGENAPAGAGELAKSAQQGKKSDAAKAQGKGQPAQANAAGQSASSGQGTSSIAKSSQSFAPPNMSSGTGSASGSSGSGAAGASFNKPHGSHYETTTLKGGGGPVIGTLEKKIQTQRNLAKVARQAIQQEYQRRLPAEYRVMTAEYFELLGSLEE